MVIASTMNGIIYLRKYMATVVKGVISLFREYSARTGSKMLYFW